MTTTKDIFTSRVAENHAYMLLNKGIGRDVTDPNEPFIDGPDFADEVYDHFASGRAITVKINSGGGRVLKGWDIIDAISESGANTFNAGVAYSMAAMALLVGKHRKAYSHAQTMIHAPYNALNPKAQSPMLEMMRNQFRAILESRTKFTKEEIDAMMTGGDHFFNAQQMLEKGIIDEIVPTGITAKTPPATASAKELVTFFNNYIDEPKKETMSIFQGIFGKTTDQESATAALAMKSENDTLKAEKVAYEAKIKELADKNAALEVEKNKIKATELIAAAKKAGKFAGIKAEDEQKLVDSAIANYDAAKLMIDSTPSGKTMSASAIISDEAKGDKLTYLELQKDAAKANALLESDPELYAKLEADYIESFDKNKK